MSMNLHGGHPGQTFERLGLPPRPVTDFSVNVNPLGPPWSVRKAWPGLISEVSRYPTLDGDGVRAFYRKRFNLPGECVLPGNGSTELIYLVPRALKIKRAGIMQPCFQEYERALRLGGAEVFSVPFCSGPFQAPSRGNVGEPLGTGRCRVHRKPQQPHLHHHSP